MPTFRQIGQRQDAFIPPNHLLQADEHYLTFVPISSVAAVKLPAATFFVVDVVVVSFMHDVCDPIVRFEYTLVR